MSIKLGKDAKIYRLTSGIRAAWPASGSPADLDEIGNVKDLTLNLEKNEADVTTRNNDGWRGTVGVLKDGSVEFQMLWDTGDADFTAIRDAWLNDTDIVLAVLDGDKDVPGNQGLYADFQVTAFTRNEPLEEAISADVTVKPSAALLSPEWVTVGT
jgi:hypothetical protein